MRRRRNEYVRLYAHWKIPLSYTQYAPLVRDGMSRILRRVHLRPIANNMIWVTPSKPPKVLPRGKLHIKVLVQGLDRPIIVVAINVVGTHHAGKRWVNIGKARKLAQMLSQRNSLMTLYSTTMELLVRTK